MGRVLFLGVLLASSVSWGWGFVGHRTTGYVAEAYLTPQAKQQVRALLQGQSLAEAATWADTLRSDPNFKHAAKYHYEGVADRGNYVDTLRRKPRAQQMEGGVVTGVLMAERLLEDPKTPPAQKQMALKFLVHFIGDLHQPMHTGRPDDAGGNAIKFEWFNQPSNLHSVWDTGMIMTGHADIFSQQQKGMDYGVVLSRWLIQRYGRVMPDPRSVGKLEVWFNESMIERTKAYDPRMRSNQKAYQQANLPVVDGRLYFAGLRIAEALNRIFAHQPMSQDDLGLIGKIEQISGSMAAFMTLGPRSPNQRPDGRPYQGHQLFPNFDF